MKEETKAGNKENQLTNRSIKKSKEGGEGVVYTRKGESTTKNLEQV